jgi:hypothetical protein
MGRVYLDFVGAKRTNRRFCLGPPSVLGCMAH